LRTDTIFYQLFQTFPTLLMELLGEDPASIASYQFTSVEVKEKAFRFDGVFLPQSEDKTIAILNENGTRVAGAPPPYLVLENFCL